MHTTDTAIEKRYKLTAAVITLIIVLLALILLMSLYLRYNPMEKRVWPPEDTSELLLDGEYVMRGDIAVPQADSKTPAAKATAPANEAHDMTDAGKAADQPAPLVSSEQESPMKANPPKEVKPTGPTKEEIAQQEKERRERDAANKINNRVAFGSSASSGNGEGKSGSPNGNAATGALSGTPGTSLSGRTLESWAKPAGSATGRIVVSVRVNRQGKVTSATYNSGSGAVASSPQARQSCVSAALKSRFSVSQDAPAEQTGTITYRFD